VSRRLPPERLPLDILEQQVAACIAAEKEG